MNLLRWLRSLFSCPHRSTYLERRLVGKVAVMHLVCECGYAVPAVQRSQAEHRRIVRAGAVRRPKAKRQPAIVLPMTRAK
jgi:hypothetical protein